MRHPADIKGEKHGTFTALERVGSDRHNNSIWKVECKCGLRRDVTLTSFRRGFAICSNCTPNTKDVLSQKPDNYPEYSVYMAYHQMKQRCLNPNDKGYHWYGGRGIEVCQRWLDSFEDFKNDMGPKPSAEHSLDRKDTNGNYEPSNCRWATKQEQSENRNPKGYLL